MRKVIITGGPNSGKSSIISLLAQRGHEVLTESARLVIEQQGIFPWNDQQLFCDVVHQEQLRRERELADDLVFLDRSLVDPVAYAEFAGVEVPQSIYEDIQKAGYHRDVFYFEMLPQYCIDRERKESPEQATAVHDKIRTVYTSLGFNIVSVPLFSHIETISKTLRLAFILDRYPI